MLDKTSIQSAINSVSVGYDDDKSDAISLIPEGLCCEFGVSKGRYTREIARLLSPVTYYGFDSFNGLPEDWEDRARKGAFKCDPPTDLGENVELVIGLFQETLKPFLEKHKEPVAFCHFDADLYSSTKYALNVLDGRFAKGAILMFDQITMTDFCVKHEGRAMQEFIEESGIKWEVIGRQKRDGAIFKVNT